MKDHYPVEILNARREMIDYTLDQQKALLSIEFFLKSAENFFLLVGNAGTGKTTIAENIANYADAMMLAPTNAAVKRLKDKLKSKKIPGNRFATLHSVLYGHPDPATGEFVRNETGFQRKRTYIIDEASMIDEQILKDIIEEAVLNRCKIIFLGDDFQLEPVSKDPHLFKWEKTNPERFKSLQRVKLHEVKRNDGNILKVATHLRNNNGVQVLNINAPDFKIVNKFSSKIVSDIREEKSYAILVATNKDRITYNGHVRKVKYGEQSNQPILENERLIAVANKLFPNGEQFQVTNPMILKKYDCEINVGSWKYPKMKQVVMYLVSHNIPGYKSKFKTMFIPNLDMPSLHSGQILSNKDLFYDKHLTEYVKPLRKRMWRSEINIATYGYAISVHKSQGNEWDNVYIDASWLSDKWNKARWMYTAITRAKVSVELRQSRQYQLVKDTDNG